MRTMCARVVMLAAVLSGAVPIAARTEPHEKFDSNIADWVETCKLRFIGHLYTSGRPHSSLSVLPKSAGVLWYHIWRADGSGQRVTTK